MREKNKLVDDANINLSFMPSQVFLSSRLPFPVLEFMFLFCVAGKVVVAFEVYAHFVIDSF